MRAGLEFPVRAWPWKASGGSVGMGLWPPLWWGHQDISEVAGPRPPGAAARPGEVFSPLGGEGRGGGEGIRTKLLFFSLFPLSLPLTTFFRLFFSPFPSIPLSCMIFSRTTFVGPRFCRRSRGNTGEEEEKRCVCPCTSLVSPGWRSLQVQILPWGGGRCVLGGSERPFLHGGGTAEGGLSMSITLPRGQRGLHWLLFHVVFKKEPEWFQAVIFCWEHPSGQVLDTN